MKRAKLFGKTAINFAIQLCFIVSMIEFMVRSRAEFKVGAWNCWLCAFMCTISIQLYF